MLVERLVVSSAVCSACCPVRFQNTLDLEETGEAVQGGAGALPDVSVVRPCWPLSCALCSTKSPLRDCALCHSAISHGAWACHSW